MPQDDLFACPCCHGHGEVRGPEYGMPWFVCQHCKGLGVVDGDDQPVSEDTARAGGYL